MSPSLSGDRLRHYFAIQYTRDGRKYPFLNCWGLVCEFYRREMGITLPSYDEYDPKTMTSGYELEKGAYTETDRPEMGCIIAFFNNAGLLYHVGVFTDSEHYLHSEYRRNTQISRLADTHSRYRIYRHRSLSC